MKKIIPPAELTFPSEITTVIFDLDGTLFDSMGVWAQIDIDFLGKRGLTPPPDYMEAITPLGFRATAEYTIQRFHLNETPEALMEEWHQMAVEAYTHHVPLKPQAKPLLERLKASGYRLGVTSASSKELALPCLSRHGITGLFDSIVTAGTDGPGKNDPGIWRISAARLGVPANQCAVLDDVAAALSAAEVAGMLPVGVLDIHSGGHQAVSDAAKMLTTLD